MANLAPILRYDLQDQFFEGPQDGAYVDVCVLRPTITVERHGEYYHVAARFIIEASILRYSSQKSDDHEWFFRDICLLYMSGGPREDLVMTPQSDATQEFTINKASESQVATNATATLSQLPSANVSIGLTRSNTLSVEYKLQSWTVSSHNVVHGPPPVQLKPKGKSERFKRAICKSQPPSDPLFEGAMYNGTFEGPRYQWFWDATQHHTHVLSSDLRHTLNRHVVVERIISKSVFPSILDPPQRDFTDAEKERMQQLMGFGFRIQVRVKRRYGRLHRLFLFSGNTVKSSFLTPVYMEDFRIQPGLAQIKSKNFPPRETNSIRCFLNWIKTKYDGKWDQLQGKRVKIASNPGDHNCSEDCKAEIFSVGDDCKCSWDDVMAFSQDGKLLASSSSDCTITLWHNLPSSAPSDGIVRLGDITKETASVPKHGTGQVSALAFSQDGKLLASASRDGTITLWTILLESASGEGTAKSGDVTKKTTLELGYRTGQVISAMAFWTDEKGKYLEVAVNDGTHWRWGLAKPDPKVGVDDDTHWRWDLAKPDLEVAVNDGTHWRWDSAKLDPEAAVDDDTHWRWDLAKLEATKQPYIHQTSALAYTPKSELQAAGSIDGTIRLNDINRGGKMEVLRGHTDQVNAVAFSPSPDHKLLVSASSDHTVRLWDVKEKAARPPLNGHTDLVRAVAFFDGGKRLMSASNDGTVRLWNV
ncbi:WD40-repeat-containing domain protein [Xylaria sp. FL0043]|nr:WD40-repeat-containing domain protein [Xylaria sp. FL0043]